MSIDVVPKQLASEIAPGDCEFCCEFACDERARFTQDYGDSVRSRIVAEQGDFVAVPTVGQLLAGSLLILPRRHFDTCAQAQASLGSADLIELVERACDALGRFGRPLIFEHGAKPDTGGACGIYHAHLHVVPAPDAVLLGELLPQRASTARSLIEALVANEASDEYLLARDTEGLVGHLELSLGERDDFPSQYLRRFLVRRFTLDRPWDWREAVAPERDLLWTIENMAGM